MSVESAPAIEAADRIIVGTYEPARAQRKPAPFSRKWIVALLTSDIAMFALASAAGVALYVALTHPARLSKFGYAPSAASAALIIALQVFLFSKLGLYRRSLALSIRDEFYYTTAALVIGALPLLVVFTILPQLSSSRLIILFSLVFSIVGVGGSRAVLHELRTVAAKRRKRRIALVGRSEDTAQAARSLNIVDGTQTLRIDLDSLAEEQTATAAFHPERLDWFRSARDWGCDTLLLTQTLPPHIMPVILRAAAKHHMKFAFAPPLLRVHAYSLTLEVDGEQALLVPAQLRACTQAARTLKRIGDVTFGSVALLLAAPVMLLCALAVKLDSRGPIFFRQERVGIDGKTFSIFKFRSMKTDAEDATGPVWASTGDDRITRAGWFLRRTSLDELPQLFNVLRGDMSIVGPRPERPVFVQQFRAIIPRYDERHLVRPGITGWSQVNMRRVLRPSDAAEKLSYDLFYVEQWSLFMDLYIVTKTAVEFLFHRSA